jgi:hypothetical protein
MGSKEWGKFGEEAWKYAQQLKIGEIPSRIQDQRHVLLLCGFPGIPPISPEFPPTLTRFWNYPIFRCSSKTRLAFNSKKYKEWRKKKICWRTTTTKIFEFFVRSIQRFIKLQKKMVKIYFKVFLRIIVRMELLMKMGVLKIDCVFFDMGVEKCREYLQKEKELRKESSENDEAEIESQFQAKLVKPFERDGFCEIFTVKNKEDMKQI